MSKYTASQVREAIESFSACDIGGELMAIAEDYAALLRERESAKAAVTDETTQIALNAYNKSLFAGSYGPDDGQPICHDYTLAMRAALEAVAPMLANAWVPDNCVLIAVERPEGYEDVHPDLVAEDFAGDALERGWAYQVIAAAPKPETEK